MADEQKVVNEEYASEILATDTDPSSNPPKEADDNEGNDDDLFADLVADEDYADEEVNEEPKPTEPAPEPAPEPEPVQPQTPPEPAPEPAPQQAAQELPQQPTAGVEGAVPPTDINAQYKEFFEKSVDILADQVYKFDEQTAEELDTNPSKVLPKIAAALHMQVLTASITQVANAFPALMELYNDRNSAEKEREDKFFGEYPELKAHKDTVLKVAKVYHSMYPNEPYETRAPKIAAMAMVEAKVPMQSAQTQQPAAAKPPIPTSARGAPSAPAPVLQKNEWTDLIEEED